MFNGIFDTQMQMSMNKTVLQMFDFLIEKMNQASTSGAAQASTPAAEDRSFSDALTSAETASASAKSATQPRRVTYLISSSVKSQVTSEPAKSTPATSRTTGANGYEDLIQKAATTYKVDPVLIRSVIQAESNFNPRAASPVGAQGLMQLMPGTARSLGVTNSLDPAQNIDGGVRLLRKLLDRYKGSTELALAAYNAGPGAVDKYQGIPPYQETQTYVKRIIGLMRAELARSG